MAVEPIELGGQEPCRVLGDAEEPRAAAEQPGRERALQCVGCAVEGQPRGDGRRGEAVIGQGDQDRFEQPQLSGCRCAQRDQRVGQFTEADLADQVAGEVASEQRDGVLGGGAERGRVRHRVLPVERVAAGVDSQARTSSVWAPSAGGGSR